VEKDQLKALNLYRRAWGAPADDLVYKSAADQKVEELTGVVVAGDCGSGQGTASHAEATAGRGTAKRRQSRDDAAPRCKAASRPGGRVRQALQKLPASSPAAPVSSVRAPASAPESPPIDRGAVDRSLGNFHFGRYYALIIGNQNYDQMESLKTPLYDAVRRCPDFEGQVWIHGANHRRRYRRGPCSRRSTN